MASVIFDDLLLLQDETSDYIQIIFSTNLIKTFFTTMFYVVWTDDSVFSEYWSEIVPYCSDYCSTSKVWSLTGDSDLFTTYQEFIV